MSERITIELDLDNTSYNTGLQDVEKNSEATAEKVGDAFDKSVARTIDGKVVKSFANLNSQLLTVTSTASKITGGLIAAVPVFVFLEKRFGVFTSLFSRLGMDFEKISDRVDGLMKSFSGFIAGEKSINGVKLAAALLLNEMGLLRSATLATFSAVETLYDKFAMPVSVAGLTAAVPLLLTMTKAGKDLKTLGAGLWNFESNSRGLFELTGFLAATSAALALLGDNMIHSHNATTRSIGSIAKFGAMITGGLSVWLGIAIIKLSELAKNIGAYLVVQFQKASDQFIETSSKALVFAAAVDTVNRATQGLAGMNSEWSETINELSTGLNLSVTSLQRAAQEIVLVGASLGLTSSQMQELLKISSEYAKINHKDVFDTTISVINALNGNAQAVQTLGIKLSEASVQQFAFGEGITQSMQKMSESERVQIRYNKLLHQYNDVAGLGAIAANTLADQQVRLKINTDRLSSAIGEGSRIIEQNNLLAFATNSIMDNVSDSVLSAAGFFGALGARVLQVGGILFGLSFKVFALYKAFYFLDILLKSNSWNDFSNKKMALINMSFQEMIRSITGANIQIKSMKDLANVIGTSVFAQFRSLLGITQKTTGATSIFKSALNSLLFSFKNYLAFLAPFLIPFAKVAIIAGLITGAIFLLKNIFMELEKRTKVFSSIYQIMVDELERSKSIFKPLIDLFRNFKDTVGEIASKTFGLFVFGLAKVVGAITALAEKNPFNVFSKETVASLSDVNSKLTGFSDSLRLVAFDISKIPVDAERAIAGSAERSKINLEELVNKLNTIRDAMKNVGMSDREVIERDQLEQLDTLNLSFQNKLIAEQEYLNLKTKINLDAAAKLKKIVDDAEEERMRKLVAVNRIINNQLANAISGGIQMMANSLAQGKSIFADFGTFLINTMGDLAIQLGQFYIAEGLAKMFLITNNPAAQIGAGVALVALGSIMKAFFAGGVGGKGGGGVAAVGAMPAPGQSSTPVPADPQSIQERKPDTRVSIVVQGSLVRQEELGQFITETLNESFAKQGVTLTDARFS